MVDDASAGEHAERAVEKTMHLVREEAEDRARIIDHDSEIDRAARKHRLDLAGTAAAVAAKGAEAEAEEEIKALHALAAKFVAVSRNQTLVHVAVEAIVAEAFKEHKAQYGRAQRDFEHNLSALNATQLAKENASDVRIAFQAARRADDELAHVEKATVHAIEEGVHRMKKQGKAQARALTRRAKEATREAKRSGKLVAKGQRAAGDAERDYESAERNSSRSAERLEERAERAGEHAERAVEDAADLVGDEARDRAHIIEQDSEIGRAARRHKLDLAEQAAAHEREEDQRRAAAAVAAAAARAKAQRKAAAEAKAQHASAGANSSGVQNTSEDAGRLAGAVNAGNHSAAKGGAAKAQNAAAGAKSSGVQNTSGDAGRPAGAVNAGNGSSAKGGAEESEIMTDNQEAKLGSQRFLGGAASGTSTADMGMLTACAVMVAVGAVSAAAVSWRAGRRSVRIGESPSLG